MPNAPRRISAKEVSEAFEKLLKERADMGLRNWLGDLFLEPRNPWQSSRREPKRSLSIAGVLVALGLSIVIYFHVL